MANTYESDFYAWTQQTADQLRSGKSLTPEDLNMVIEEIEDLGRRHFDSLVSYCALYLLHRLKWDYQPELQSRSWMQSMEKTKNRISLIVKKHPSLRAKLPDAWSDGYEYAAGDAAVETGLPKNTFPDENPYTLQDFLDPIL